MGHNDGKTEKATPQRRRQARREGQVARSQEVGVALSLGGLALALKVAGPPSLEALRSGTITLLTRPADLSTLGEVGQDALRMLAALLIAPLAIGTLAAVLSGAQTGYTLATKAARPKLSHLSPARGLQRLKPGTAVWELVRSLAKLGLLFALVWGPLQTFTGAVPTARSLDDGVAVTLSQTWALLLRGLLAAGIVAAADYVWNLRKVSKQLRMSKEEIKQEYRNAEGDPHIKMHRRRRHQELSRNRMLFETASADVVVTNPTHLAVALRFSPGEAAPRVVAKGADKLAARIRETAYRHGVPVRRDVPLARALHRHCKVGSYVPAALYEAVAVVLAYAYRIRGRAAA